jgi:hypothetical protein
VQIFVVEVMRRRIGEDGDLSLRAALRRKSN